MWVIVIYTEEIRHTILLRLRMGWHIYSPDSPSKLESDIQPGWRLPARKGTTSQISIDIHGKSHGSYLPRRGRFLEFIPLALNGEWNYTAA